MLKVTTGSVPVTVPCARVEHNPRALTTGAATRHVRVGEVHCAGAKTVSFVYCVNDASVAFNVPFTLKS